MAPHSFQNPLFIDIETVSSASTYEELTPAWQALWVKKAKSLGYSSEEEQKAAFGERAAIYAEFGRVVVIALGYIEERFDMAPILRLHGLTASTEKELLVSFANILQSFPPNLHFCGHNIKEFDLPYLCRRLVVHGIPLPKSLDMAGKKPWEVHHEDTLEMWKFGDRKSYTSLDLLANLLGIPSSKSTLDGSEVGHYFYEKKDLESIRKYCIDDVIVTTQVYRKLKQLPLLHADSIQIKA